MDDLSPEQQASVMQLRELTNGGDDEVAISVLRSVDWDVQRAADLVFGGGGGLPPPPPPPPEVQDFEIDDSEQGHEYPPHYHVPQQQQPNTLATITRPILSFVTLPFSLLSSLLRFIFSILRIPFPNLRFPGLAFLGFHTPRPRPTYRGGPDRWLRELEEETGAISIGRVKGPKGTSSSLRTSNGEAGPSTLTSRGTANGNMFEEGRRLLPDFQICTYEEALKTCQRDIRIGCIILVSEEHDDVAEFKRSTLTDPILVKALHDNNILVWGGDVKDIEAWSAAEKLQATTYPFVAFVALQPRRTVGASPSSRNNSPPSLTVLSRHQGKSISDDSPTSATTLVHHLESQVIPRVSSYLDRLRNIQRERERDRQLREEQDRAFADAARRDVERIQAKMEAERIAEEARRAEEARLRAEAEIQRKKEEERMEWRRWIRGALQSKSSKGPKSLRVAIRLPNGERTIQLFSPSDTLTTLYATVDAQLIPSQYSASDDPSSPPSLQHGDLEAVLDRHVSTHASPTGYWGFLIASSFPRAEIPWSKSVELATISHLKGGGQVVVELADRSPPGTRATSAQGRNGVNGGNDSDGYDTEEE